MELAQDTTNCEKFSWGCVCSFLHWSGTHLRGDLCDLAEYENYLQATEALCVNDCKSLTSAAASELSMIKQRLSRNETHFLWVEGATMSAEVLTKGKARGHIELLKKLLHTARYQIRATSEMLEDRQARERKLLGQEERR